MKTRDMILTAMFAVLMVVSTKITIPMPIIPFTLQPLVCSLAGLLLTPKLSAAAMALYMLMGLLGLPVFTFGGGLQSVISPSFGYIIGFIIADFTIGVITHSVVKEKRTFALCFAASLIGLAIIYGLGVSYLYVVLNYLTSGRSMSLIRVIQIGFLTTIGPDIIKAAVASLIAVRLFKTSVIQD